MKDDKALNYVNRKREARKYSLEDLIIVGGVCLLFGILIGAFFIMIQHQHKIIALMELYK